jgi:hypothetical protein
MWIISDEEKRIISSLTLKGREEQARNERFALIDVEIFYRLFSDDEIALIKKYRAIDPAEIGYKLPYLGLEGTPSDIVAIANQAYMLGGKECIIPCQYLPKEAYDAYRAMNDAMTREIGRGVLVLYGYRSLARQIFIFFDILERKYDFDVSKTLRRVCFPEYSEHVYWKKQAIDFMTKDDTASENFDKTDEYQWLKNNAGRFYFHESYPRDNEHDMMYEPWHWHYEV